MKILNLKFKNINSLSGEHEIDFSMPPLSRYGIFAITGKTGSGKTSILDAITLALYGKTPRATKVTSNENPILTKGEKDCYAEITFQIHQQQWKASWKQETDKKGKLKPIVRQIALANGQILTDKASSCDEQITKILGLNFEQFTKVILLPQGDFAAFLEAEKNDKGAILEKITGTEIYAQISQKVFQKAKQEKEKLDKIHSELQTLAQFSLPENELQSLQLQKEQLKINLQQTSSTLNELKSQLKLLQEIQNLQQQLHSEKQKLPLLHQQLLTANQNLQQYQQELQNHEKQLEHQQPIFSETRKLDTLLTEKNKTLNPLQNTILTLNQNISQLSKQIHQAQINLQNTHKQLHTEQEWITQNQKLEELTHQYAALEIEHQQLQQSQQTIKTIQNQITQIQQELQQLETLYNQKHTALQQTQTQLHQHETQLNELSQQLQKLPHLNELLAQKDNLTALLAHLHQLTETSQNLQQTQNEIHQLSQNLTQYQTELQTLSTQIEKETLQLQENQKKIELLQNNIQLTRIIQSLEEHRKALKDGEPCPLCGSTHHPYASNNTPQLGTQEQELQNLLQLNQSLQHHLTSSQQKQAALLTHQQNTQQLIQKQQSLLSQLHQKQKEIYSNIQTLYPHPLPNVNELPTLLNTQQQKLSQTENTIQQYHTLLNQQTKLQQSKEKLYREKEQQEKDQNETNILIKSAQEKLKVLQNQLEDKTTEYRAHHSQFLQKVQYFGVENFAALSEPLQNWNTHQQQLQKLKEQLTTQNNSLQLLQKDLENQKALLQQEEEKKQALQNELEDLRNKRKELFGDKSVEDEEKRLKAQIEQFKQALQAAQKKQNETLIALEKQETIIKEKETELETKSRQAPTSQTPQELENAIQTQENHYQQISEAIGKITQQIEYYQQNLNLKKLKDQEYQKQKEITEKWEKLNEMIGSADGKKYRNFAQTLTFEHLVFLANRQLQRFSDRYLLQRTQDPDNPFLLSVLDHYQNGIQRTVENLSGGEKFIVSLALALGLANMVSRNMQIQTMFIDEGFGTLDANYLDIVLSTLANLQNEGKTIGIISHVPEIKERIPCHLEVLPNPHKKQGHSKIQISSVEGTFSCSKP